jgi:hypothetical protein
MISGEYGCQQQDLPKNESPSVFFVLLFAFKPEKKSTQEI